MSQHTNLTGAERWRAVDAYVEEHHVGEDAVAARVLANQRAAGLPNIAVSAAQGKLLEVLARAVGAVRVLEFGTLGGYSTLWLARALPDHGRIVTFELSPEHAAIARASLDEAGVGHQVEIRVGAAIDNLHTLEHDDPYDLVFIDADKPSNADYYEAAMTRAHAGTLIVIDNVVRDGAIVDADDDTPAVAGSRRVIELVGADARVSASVVQTVGAKLYDGMLIATVL